MRSPFSLYVKTLKSGKVWYARFWDYETCKYIADRSTGIPCTGKKGRKIEANDKAREIYESLKNKKSCYLIPYLESFWKEDSKYFKAKRVVEKKPVSAYYIELNANCIKNHIKPYKPFNNVLISELKPGIIEDWKLWVLEQGKGARIAKISFDCIRTAIRYAVTRGDIQNDPFIRIKGIAHTPKEKGILTKEEVCKLINVEEADKRVKLAVLLGGLAGMRRGEVRGLKWNDIDFKNNLINVQNNYVDTEGLKGCKCGSERPVLLYKALIPVLDELKSISPYTSPDDFVMFSLHSREVPFSNCIIQKGFDRMLRNIGISNNKRKEKNITFHSLRHTFVTLARMAGISDLEVQALTGHKSPQMMNHYSHAGQVINFEKARERFEKVTKIDSKMEQFG